MKKIISLMVILVLALALLTGCGSGGEQPLTDNSGDQGQKQGDEPLKVALLLPGPINDMGWNASAYEGLQEAKEKFGAEIAYTEKVVQSDMEEYFRGYANQGYDIIFGHGFQFGDAAKQVAAEYKDTIFIVTSSDISQAPNLGSVNIDNELQGFLMGAVAGLTTKSNVVGAIGGQEIPPIVGSVDGFKKGAEYVNPDVKVLTTLTGSFEDVAKAKETAMAMIDNGADVVMANANQAGLGSIEACEEKGVLAIGSNQDQNDVAPDTVMISGIKSVPRLISFVIEKYQSGEWEPKFYNLGIKEGAVYLSPWHGFEDKIPQEVKDQLDEIISDLESGKLDVSEY